MNTRIPVQQPHGDLHLELRDHTYFTMDCRKTPKKVSACAFTLDGAHALFADRFGDVKAEPTAAASSSGTPPADAAAPQVPATMLGHFCAIITSLSVSQDGR